MLKNCLREDIQRIVLNVDLIFPKGTNPLEKRAYLAYNVVYNIVCYTYSLKQAKTLLVLPTPKHCKAFQDLYSTLFGVSRDALPMILGSRDQTTEAHQNAYRIFAEPSCPLAIGSPAATQGTTVFNLLTVVQISQQWGGFNDKQTEGRAHRSGCFDPLTPVGYSFVFLSVRDVFSDDQFSSSNDDYREIQRRGRDILRKGLSSVECAATQMQQYQCTPSNPTSTSCGVCRLCARH